MLTPSPVPLPIFLVVKKRFEYFCLNIVTHADAVVGHGHDHVAVFGMGFNLQPLLHAFVGRLIGFFVHGVDGIGYQVDKNLFQPVVVGHNAR